MENETNKQIAVDTIAEMAKYCDKAGDTCYGVGILNEYQRSPWHIGVIPFFLRDYYDKAILAARKHMSMDKQVVLFNWGYDSVVWILGEHFTDSKKYGNIIWDFHMYTKDETDYHKCLWHFAFDLFLANVA